MSVGAVLAHEYYGHRAHRQEYLDDYKKGHDFHSTPIWQDECRASIVAAKTAPNLTDIDTCNLVMDAIYRADEYNHYIEIRQAGVYSAYILCETAGRLTKKNTDEKSSVFVFLNI